MELKIVGIESSIPPHLEEGLEEHRQQQDNQRNQHCDQNLPPILHNRRPLLPVIDQDFKWRPEDDGNQSP